MKKIVLFLALILSLAATKTFAQNGGSGNRMQQMQQQYQAYLKDSVGLSDAMVDSVLAIRKEYQPKMRDIFTDQSGSADDKQTKMQALRTEMESRYKSAGLSDNQVATIHQHEEAMRAQMMARRNNGGGGGGN